MSNNILQFPNLKKKAKAKKTSSESKSRSAEVEKRAKGLLESQAAAEKAPAEAKVLDVTERIAAQQASDRRQVQRVVFNEFISAHVHIPGRGLLKVILKNIHQNGLGFDVDEAQGQFPQGEEVEMRFYLNHQTFFRFVCRVVHTHYIKEEGIYRHGCQFAANTINEVALKHFIGFLENISASLMTDKGDRTISRIYS